MNVLARTFPSTALLCPFFFPQLSGAVAGELPCFLFLLLLDIYQKKKSARFRCCSTQFLFGCAALDQQGCAQEALSDHVR